MNEIIDIPLEKFPTILITDVHKDVDKVRKIKALYPDQPIYCLGDICDLFDITSGSNAETIQYFKDNHIPSLMGNHETAIIADVLGKAGYVILGAVKADYNVSKEDAEYLLTFPRGFRFQLPDQSHILCFHNKLDCLWSFTNASLTEEEFIKLYPVTSDTRVVIIGHQHRTFTNSTPYNKTRAYLQALGRLQKDGVYALVYPDKIEIKKL